MASALEYALERVTTNGSVPSTGRAPFGQAQGAASIRCFAATLRQAQDAAQDAAFQPGSGGGFDAPVATYPLTSSGA